MRFKKALSLALSVWITGALLLTAPVAASPTTLIYRVMGSDRYLTAVAVSQKGWELGAGTVVLTTGENFPDALSAAPLALKYAAPILLTESDRLGSATLAEIKRLEAKKAYIVGGTGVISEIVERQLAPMGVACVRIAGQDRFETSLLVAKEVGVSKGIFVTGGADYHDALAAASIAAIKNMPVLLVPSGDLTEAQKEFLEKSKIPATYIVNDTEGRTISEQVVEQFPEAEIISGDTSYERNVNLLERFLPDLDFSTIYAATGKNFPDALAASALASKNHNAIIMLEDDVPQPVISFLNTKAVGTFNILGGYGAVPLVMEDKLRAQSLEIAAIEDIYQSIQSKQKYTLPETVVAMLTNNVMTDVRVTWDLVSVDTSRLGTSYYMGKVNGYKKTIQLALSIVPADTYTINAITAETILGRSYDFPATVKVVKSDYTTQDLPVTWSSSAVTTIPSKAGTFTYQGTVEGISQKVKLTLKVVADAKITFKDVTVDRYMRLHVNKSSTDTLYKSDVIDLEYLDLSDNGIEDISGLEYLTNLKFLNLNYNRITKVTSLNKLTNLGTLLLTNNLVTDVASLKSMTKLEVLSLKNNKVKDFTALKSLTALKQLYLEYNATTDYTPLALIYKNLIAKDFDL
ncbi:MAG: leucine-rich repeat protein [Peptococcaceae bacterium]|nr:leucine-rich repeat protein [Peptococcaceae bacterium]